jgi:hypothetical protein
MWFLPFDEGKKPKLDFFLEKTNFNPILALIHRWFYPLSLLDFEKPAGFCILQFSSLLEIKNASVEL